MTKNRLEAFSDGIIAIIITITVLMIEAPNGDDVEALKEILPLIVVYTVSFIMIGTNWANHHHLLQVTEHVNGKIIWANHFYLFTLSFYPVATAWVGKTNFACLPTVVYGFINLIESIAYIILQRTIISSHDCAMLKNIVDKSKKEFFTILFEIIAIVFSFIDILRYFAFVMLLIMTMLWIIPDLRLNKVYMDSKIHNEE